MIRRPFSTEWDTSQLPGNRQAYLTAVSFEEIVSRVVEEAQVVRGVVEPYRMPVRGEPKEARQIVFLFRIRAETCDILYNAPDGLRARYWQSPDHGSSANSSLIGALLVKLLTAAERNPPSCDTKITPMTPDDVRASLRAPSAKVWPRERDDQKTSLLVDQELIVPRWQENERHAEINKGMWRRTPTGGDLEIKGALLGSDGTEYVPDGKRDRSCQIFRFGYT
jgi:hypothetical protein